MTETATLVAEQLTVTSEHTELVSALSLAVDPGEMLGITGPSGSGKSSLVHVLAGLAAPASGRLRFADRQMAPGGGADVGLILQHHHLPAMLTAHEVVSLPLQAHGLARAEVTRRSDHTLAAVGLSDHAHQLISQLSGGQRQRVAVARALASDPQLLIADEPTAGLDPDSRTTVTGLLLAAADRGATVIIATSDPELIDQCTRAITLGGR